MSGRVDLRRFYKIIRNILVTLLLAAAGLYALIYVSLLLPPVQKYICRTAERELSALTGGSVSIGGVSIFPFNEVVVRDVSLHAPDGSPVLSADKVGAGLSMHRLLRDRRLVFTYAEIMGLDGHITQQKKGGPLNIQFLIDAFKPKDRRKPPTKFDLVINNIVLRKCRVTFDRMWMPRKKGRVIDFNHLVISDIAADLRFPVLRNEDFDIDLRRLAFTEASGLKIDKISGKFHISPDRLSIAGLDVEMPGSSIQLSDINFEIDGFKNIGKQLLSRPLSLVIPTISVTPGDFAAFLPALARYRQRVLLSADLLLDSGNLSVESLNVDSEPGMHLRMRGMVNGITGPREDISFMFPLLDLKITSAAVHSVLDDFVTLKPDVEAVIRRCGDISVNASVEASGATAGFDGDLEVAQGATHIEAVYHKQSARHFIKARINTPGFELGQLLDKADVGRLATNADIDLEIQGRDVDGSANIEISQLGYKGYNYTGIIADVIKTGHSVSGEIHASDPNLDFDISGSGALAGAASRLDISADIRTLNMSPFKLPHRFSSLDVSGGIDVSLTGNSLDNANGYIDVNDLHFDDGTHAPVSISHLRVESQRQELPYTLSVDSEIIKAGVQGDFAPSGLPDSFKSLAARFMPDLVMPYIHNSGHSDRPQSFTFSILLPKDSPLADRVKLPVSLLEDLELSGSYDSASGQAALDMDVPYLRQGRSKLVRDTRLALRVDTAANLCNLSFTTRIPNNKGDITLMLDANAANDRVQTDVSWSFDRKKAYRGLVSLTASFPRCEESARRDVAVNVNPSRFEVNDTVWNVSPGRIMYQDKSVLVDSVRVGRPGQFVLVNGRATASPDDKILVDLRDIDLDYVFETLNINYVTFGGRASGRVEVSSLFSGSPVLATEQLSVKRLTYNNSLLGNALIDSHWDNGRKSVYLDARISENKNQVARIYGDIFATRDSLSLHCDARKVNIGFMQPFMAAFSSAIEGRASGKVHLYGTFKDIDLAGKVFADSLRMKIDVTNTWYSASDTVVMRPGRIILDDITLRDRDGHTALLNGEVRHRYFHDPSFDFTITKARNFLCYDTNAALNPVWYGTIYGNGSGSLHGVPGFINVMVDMTSAPGSTFTFVLDDSEEAMSYQFITFTDKRKAAIEAAVKAREEERDDRPVFLKEFERQAARTEAGTPTRYSMDIRMTATPAANLTLVMDPVAGDRIKANGSGNMRMSYNSEGDMSLYGTYTLTKGTYNFTMQDFIVRDFKIRDGSKITFNGDPLAAVLDITAAYRVNTSLTDLDKSFASDRELNRTNVPVEALLKVSGNMQSPDINFDIELPTLTQDVARKVRSIISTSDMMNRQIIYLLALNRFYTPDYMGTEGNNNELASVASTTLSTQLSSMLGQLAPNWSFSPYFRTDKGDFSDMEVDLALSSTLLNNRLLLNGNFGYRDRSTSSTTFVGDFDIEYLLNRSGTLRLKAYNHFNDQNYYLRSALTTQGLGIVFKRDFSRFLPGLFRRRRHEVKRDTVRQDSSIVVK